VGECLRSFVWRCACAGVRGLTDVGRAKIRDNKLLWVSDSLLLFVSFLLLGGRFGLVAGTRHPGGARPCQDGVRQQSSKGLSLGSAKLRPGSLGSMSGWRLGALHRWLCSPAPCRCCWALLTMLLCRTTRPPRALPCRATSTNPQQQPLVTSLTSQLCSPPSTTHSSCSRRLPLCMHR
jgi:hypothetical protein